MDLFLDGQLVRCVPLLHRSCFKTTSSPADCLCIPVQIIKARGGEKEEEEVLEQKWSRELKKQQGTSEREQMKARDASAVCFKVGQSWENLVADDQIGIKGQ